MSHRPGQHPRSAASASGIPPCDCAKDPVEGLKRMFVDYFQGKQIESGEVPAQRPVFRRMHGAAHGTFVVRPDLPRELRVGVFAQRSEYPVWVRFSTDVQPGSPDFRGTCGVGIKLFGVEGEKVMFPDEDATTQDFLFQNFPVFFSATARDMCEATQAALQGAAANAAYLKAHPRTAEIQNAMEVVVPTVLGTPYWSVIPFRFGEGRFVKYSLEPEAVPPGDGKAPDYADPFYLRADLHERMASGESRFRFMVQFYANEAETPLDDATVEWSPRVAPPVHVATLVLPRQELGTRGQANYGDNLAFNPWHSLPVHEPVGSIAEARKVAYRASAKARRDVNGVPLAEPVEPRPAEFRPGEPYPAGKDTVIVRAAIHPAIGIARMGNSEEFFVGPEVTEPAPREPGFYRDGAGALKRQAARFRVYGYNAAGEVVRELTADWADVHWTAHVANRKAWWYQWVQAMDIYESKDLKVPLRNASVKGAAREQLVIDGGPVTIEGKSTWGSAYTFEGEFQGTQVYLGELRTDEAGRLLFLGGRGKSGSPSGNPIYDPTQENAFINAEGWYDDASDGPVTARVVIEGREIPVEPAWVVTAPPNYAPDVIDVRTLYDLLVDLYVRNGWMEFPETVSFTRDVYPILRRMSGLQWVNKGFAIQFGRGGPNDFENPEYVARLGHDPKAGGSDTWGELRRQVFNAFRPPHPKDGNLTPWPWIYGDGDSIPGFPDAPNQNLSLSATQHRILQAWADGNFVPDWGAAGEAPHDFKQVPLQEQPGMLDKAALHFCLADAFHPGCEVTWPIRHMSMFTAPFRIRHRPAGEPDPLYGKELTQAKALAEDGPLYAQGPGDLTKWMGLPWQEDTAYCRSGYDPTYDPYLPTFWPARVPNQVLTRADYEKVMDDSLPREERQAAFNRRAEWTRLLGTHSTPAEVQMMRMVHHFGDMGVVEVRPGVPDDPNFPPVMMVESAIGVPAGQIPWHPELMMAAAPAAEKAAASDEAGEATRPERFTGRAEFVRFHAIRYPVRAGEAEKAAEAATTSS